MKGKKKKNSKENKFFFFVSDSSQPFNLTQNPEAIKEMTYVFGYIKIKTSGLSLWRGPTFFLNVYSSLYPKTSSMSRRPTFS